MSPTPSENLPPIRRTISVPWDPRAAFDRFTLRFAEWWPVGTHSIGEKRVARVIFEPREGGLICEEHQDGRRFQWGQVTLWEPPQRVGFTWHPAREPATAQQVEVSFVPEGSGTRVQLVSGGWENWEKGAKMARRGYDVGWGYVLNIWAERRTGSMAVMDALTRVAQAVQWLRGGIDAAIRRAGGEIRSAETTR
jgi:hypothetical protein